MIYVLSGFTSPHSNVIVLQQAVQVVSLLVSAYAVTIKTSLAPQIYAVYCRLLVHHCFLLNHRQLLCKTLLSLMTKNHEQHVLPFDNLQNHTS